MPDGIYTQSLLVEVQTSAFGSNELIFLVSLQVQEAIYHLYRLRQVRVDQRDGIRDHGLRDDGPSWHRWYLDNRKYLLRLKECLELERERYESVGMWDLERDFGPGIMGVFEIIKRLDREFCVAIAP